MANDKTTALQVDFSRLPRHVAIILDGNGRWAKKRGLPRTAGHAYGAEAFRRIGNYCKAIGIEYLTVYAFSTENWRRPPEEVRTIMSIFDKYMKEALSIMERDKFKAQKKKSEITEDDLKIIEKDLQKLTDDYIKEVERIADEKEKELMEI